jgi:hypothetical protein
MSHLNHLTSRKEEGKRGRRNPKTKTDTKTEAAAIRTGEAATNGADKRCHVGLLLPASKSIHSLLFLSESPSVSFSSSPHY